MYRRRFAALALLISLVPVGGCGLLPTDKVPTGGHFSVNYYPDPEQPAWQRMLFGTRWRAEGPAQ